MPLDVKIVENAVPSAMCRDALATLRDDVPTSNPEIAGHVFRHLRHILFVNVADATPVRCHNVLHLCRRSAFFHCRAPHVTSDGLHNLYAVLVVLRDVEPGGRVVLRDKPVHAPRAGTALVVPRHVPRLIESPAHGSLDLLHADVLFRP